MTKRSLFARRCRTAMLCATLALGISGSAVAQGTAAKTTGSPDLGGYSTWDVSPFIGWQWFQFKTHDELNRGHAFDDNIIWGERATEDFSNRFSLEEDLATGYNRLKLYPWGNPSALSLSDRNIQISADLVYHFAPRTAKVRPFIVVGPGFTWWNYGKNPIQHATFPATPPYAPLNTIPLKNGYRPTFTYGAGVKILFNRYVGMRFDVRGMISDSPQLVAGSAPTGVGSFFMKTSGQHESAIAVETGIILRMGYKSLTPPTTAITQSLRIDIPAAGAAPTISGAQNVCAGDDLRLTANGNGFQGYQWMVNGQPASGATGAAFSVPTAGAAGNRAITVQGTTNPVTVTSAPFAAEYYHTFQLSAEIPNLGNRTATYQWMMNGTPIQGATGSSISLPDGTRGTVTVQAVISDAQVTSAAANLQIQAVTPPTISFAVNPNRVAYNSAPIALAATAAPSPCSGAVRVTYSGEGVTGTSFNPGSVSGFDMANRLREQTKVVHITATATGAKGQSATAGADVTVTLGPEARRLDDVLFPAASSRVNNCGKRLLLEELTPMLRNDPGAKVILIGHSDTKERNKKLSEARIVSAAAVLSAGKGICPALDLSRILEQDAGTDQSSAARPNFCGPSTNVKERGGQTVKETDKSAENRRVEVWIVPSGAAMPAGVNATPVPTAAVSKLGCPK